MKYPLFLFLSLFSISVAAQVNKTHFKGIIADEEKLPIPGATVMILHASDSTLLQFGSTDNHGEFSIRNIAKGDYFLNVNFLGMQPLFHPITSGQQEEVDLGTLTLIPAATLLNEVQVKADHNPITIKKDTISYNPDAFQTQPNAVVEDLLKKLPGIEVAADGSIKAQGEDVKKVLVDGKEFFGSDPKIATKNLPAKALKKVNVYDKQSDMAEFTGVDDGEREKTIDLQLREEFKKGLFGTAQAGYGSDSRYSAKASINRFSKKTQLSFLGQLNNVNDQGFSFTDRMNFSGGMGRGNAFSMGGSGIPFSDGSGTGLINTGAAGFNFNWLRSKNFNIRSSYFYNNVSKELDQFTFRQTLSDRPFDTDEEKSQDTENRSHSLSLNSDIKIDSTQQLQIRATLGLGNGISNSTTLLENIAPVNMLENRSVTNTDNASDNLSLNTTATYVKRMGNKGKNISFSGNITKGDQDNENLLAAINEYFSTGNTELLDQLQFSRSNDTRLDGQISYTQPLKKRRFLEFSYNFNTLEADYDKNVEDIINNIPVVNPALSTDYTSVFQYHRPGMTFRYSGEVNNINAGVQLQASELTGHLNQNENEIKRTYNHILPRFTWRSDIGNGKHLRFSYNTRVSQPSITQLSPVIDNSDPLRLYVGNPGLNAEYNHNLSLNFHSFSQFSSTSFFASVGGGITTDKIINSRTVDELFVETTSPINIDQEMRWSLYSSFGRPLKLIHSRYNLNLNLSYTNTQNVINSALLDVDRWTRSGGITISNLNSKVLEYTLGGKWTFTDNYYKSDESLDQSTLLHNYYINLTLTLWKKWRVEGNYNYNLYTSNQFSDNQSLPLLGASISRYILPGDKGQLKLSVFDVLDENRGLSRNANINYLEEVRSNSVGRYTMLSFIYSIRSASGPAPGEFRFIERRN